MELSVLERLKLLECLPREGDYTTIKIVRELREALSFKENEHIEFGIETFDPGQCMECDYTGFAAADDSCPQCHGGKFKKSGQQQINWNLEASRNVKIDIGVKGKGIVVKTLEELSKSNGVTEQHVTLFEKFIGD